MFCKKLITLLLVFNLSTLFATSITFTKEVNVIMDDNFIAGGMASVMLYPVLKEFKATATLIDAESGDIKAKTKFYNYELEDGLDKEAIKYSAMFANLGISNNLTAKNYILKITINDGFTETETDFSVDISAKTYKEETINISKKASKLASEKDSSNKDDYRIPDLTDFSDKVYSIDKISDPIKEKYIITSEFGLRRNFIYNNGDSVEDSGFDTHDGIDYAGLKEGTAVYSVMRGKVVYAGLKKVTGWTVIVEHLPGVYSHYYHLSSIRVLAGFVINADTSVGTLGNTGFSTAAHLHLGMFASGVAVDPAQFLIRPIFNTDWFLAKIKVLDTKRSVANAF